MIHQECVGGPDNGAAPAFPILRLRESTKRIEQQKVTSFQPDMRADSFYRDESAGFWDPTALPHTGKMLSIQQMMGCLSPTRRSVNFRHKTTVLWLLGPSYPKRGVDIFFHFYASGKEIPFARKRFLLYGDSLAANF